MHLNASQFIAKYDNSEDQWVLQTHHHMATHDAPWSFLFTINKDQSYTESVWLMIEIGLFTLFFFSFFQKF